MIVVVVIFAAAAAAAIVVFFSFLFCGLGDGGDQDSAGQGRRALWAASRVRRSQDVLQGQEVGYDFVVMSIFVLVLP